MKNLSIKTLITLSIACMGLLGIVRAQEAVVEVPAGITINGELSTDITFGDATSFVSPYTGITINSKRTHDYKWCGIWIEQMGCWS